MYFAFRFQVIHNFDALAQQSHQTRVWFPSVAFCGILALVIYIVDSARHPKNSQGQYAGLRRL